MPATGERSEDPEADGAMVSVWKVPNESSSAMRSTFLDVSPGTGNESACGKGDGGAGHCPGLAAAISIRLSVR